MRLAPVALFDDPRPLPESNLQLLARPALHPPEGQRVGRLLGRRHVSKSDRI